MDFQDLANLHNKLDGINESIRAANPNNSSSSSGPVLETSTKLILFPIILAVLFVFSIISTFVSVILTGTEKVTTGFFGLVFIGTGFFLKKLGVDVDGEYGILIVLLFTGLILLLFLLATILIIVAIVKKKRRKKKNNPNYKTSYKSGYTSGTSSKNSNENSVEMSKEQYAEYCKTLDDKVTEMMKEKYNKK